VNPARLLSCSARAVLLSHNALGDAFCLLCPSFYTLWKALNGRCGPAPGLESLVCQSFVAGTLQPSGMWRIASTIFLAGLVVSVARDGGRQSILDAGGDEGDRSTEMQAESVSEPLRVCGIDIPQYDYAAFSSVAAVNGPATRFEVVKLNPDATLKLTGGKERRYMAEPFSCLFVKKDAFSKERATKKVLRESIIGRLVTDASLPESPINANLGVAVKKKGDPEILDIPAPLQQFENTITFQQLLTAGPSEKEPSQRAKDISSIWSHYANVVSFMPPIPPPSSPATSSTHDSIMAQTLDAITVIIQQALLALLHLRELGVSNNNIKPAVRLISSSSNDPINDELPSLLIQCCFFAARCGLHLGFPLNNLRFPFFSLLRLCRPSRWTTNCAAPSRVIPNCYPYQRRQSGSVAGPRPLFLLIISGMKHAKISQGITRSPNETLPLCHFPSRRWRGGSAKLRA
jgi:hypothetical protein